MKDFVQKAWCKGGGEGKGWVIKSVAKAFKFVASACKRQKILGFWAVWENWRSLLAKNCIFVNTSF